MSHINKYTILSEPNTRHIGKDGTKLKFVASYSAKIQIATSTLTEAAHRLPYHQFVRTIFLIALVARSRPIGALPLIETEYAGRHDLLYPILVFSHALHHHDSIGEERFAQRTHSLLLLCQFRAYAFASAYL